LSSLLITGATGFVGRHLLLRLQERGFRSVICISRRRVPPAGFPQGTKFLQANLLELQSLEPQLAGVETIVHLAAQTGKARPEEYFRVNLEGTRQVVALARRLGIRRLLFVSTIAVRFPDKSRYPYARSKEQAEEIVRQSGLRYVIVRPTLIIGPHGGAYTSLAKLARHGIVPVPGDGAARVQPVHVDDLVEFLVAIVEKDMFANQTLELGGPEVVSIEELLKKIHYRARGTQARTIHIPMGLCLRVLSAMESVAFPVLPLTAGQLSTFRFDGVAETSTMVGHRGPLKTLDQMLAARCADDGL